MARRFYHITRQSAIPSIMNKGFKGAGGFVFACDNFVPTLPGVFVWEKTTQEEFEYNLNLFATEWNSDTPRDELSVMFFEYDQPIKETASYILLLGGVIPVSALKNLCILKFTDPNLFTEGKAPTSSGNMQRTNLFEKE